MYASIISLLSGLFLAACTMVGIRNTEEPPFTVLLSDGNIEIRAYKPVIIAETLVSGDYKTSGSLAFRRLAGFIFGDNKANTKMAMTTPVYRESNDNEVIEMTAPVWQQKQAEQWLMAFVMPEHYTLATLPQPNDQSITIRQIPAKQVAVLQYSGALSEEIITEQAKTLSDWLNSKQIKALSTPRSAAYDPPWTIPQLRRNEIHIDIEGGIYE